VPLWHVRQLARWKLVRTLRWVWKQSPAQRRRWQEAGIGLSDLRSPAVLERLPFTTGDALSARPEDFFCTSPDDFVHVISTSGTTGATKTVYLTQDDFERQMALVGMVLRRLPGARRALVMFSVFEPTWSGAGIARRGLEAAGILALSSGTHQTIAEQVRLIREYRINVLVAIPAYLHRLTLEAGVDLKALGIRYLLMGGQAWTEEFRRDVEAAWGAKMIDIYGSTEGLCGVATECLQQDGLHLAELEYWGEIVDPKTGKTLPDGQDGELVFTTLSRRGMPLVRYRTGDIAHLLPRTKRCPCRLPVRKMSRIRGRVDDMVIIGGGDNIYPDEFDRAVLAVRGVSDYQITLEKDGYRDVVHLAAEADPGAADLGPALAAALEAVKGIRTARAAGTAQVGTIRVVARGTLSEGRPKSIRIVDKRGTFPTGPA
jgi:phenylacetate-CoA ligase